MEEELGGGKNGTIPFLHFSVQLQNVFAIEINAALTKEALEQDYDIHTGAISFDNSQIIKQRLRRFLGTEAIKAYGINNIRELEANPTFLRK